MAKAFGTGAAGWTAIEGWEIEYYEPTYGTRTYRETTHKALAVAVAHHDAEGHSYTIREIAKGARRSGRIVTGADLPFLATI